MTYQGAGSITSPQCLALSALPDPVRETAPSHGSVRSWPMPWRGQEEVRESGRLLTADAEAGQNPGSGETKALRPSPTPAPRPRGLPFRPSPLRRTGAALSLPPPRPARPRAQQLTALRQGSLCHACQSSANIRPGGGTGTAPSGAPQLPSHFRHSFFLLPACCPVQTWLSGSPAHFRQSPTEMPA